MKLKKNATPHERMKHFERYPGDRCPYVFEAHGSHVRQQCTRESGHPLGGNQHHHCAGVKK